LNPGKISQWSMSDNAPAPVVGTYGRWYRTSTTRVSFGTSGLIPSSFFTTTDKQSADLTWTPGSNNMVTVRDANPYNVTVECLFSAPFAEADTLYQFEIEVDGTVQKRGAAAADYRPHEFSTAGGGTYTPHDIRLRFSATVYCNANSQIKVGWVSSVAKSGVGEATGLQTFLEVVKVG